MRIQHNIAAMSSYRNYTNNVSAVNKNLEKLSSGYKINRAGDDAAGLAISEKMRAQISGLEAAQKNAKDGISLVQTAEGALTEVHDMLNRMVTLATQSANGTYDNDTDRYQLQKEMDQLRSEIDRIADSSNFNGINLLDGSMDAGGDVTYTTGSFEVTGEHATSATGAIQLPAKGTVLGTNTVLHSDAVTGNDTNSFAIDLHNTTLAAGATLSIELGGGDKLEITNSGNAAMTATDIVNKIKAGSADVSLNSTALTGTSDLSGASLTGLGGTWDITTNGTRITFTQTDDTDVTVPSTVTVTGTAGAGNTGTGNGTQAVADIFKVDSITQTGTTGGENIVVTVAYTDANGDAQTEDVTFSSGADADASMAALVTALNNNTTLKDLFKAEAVTAGDATAGITLTSQTAGANLKVTGITQKTAGANDSISFGTSSHPTAGADATTGSTNTTSGTAMTGDYNVTTTVISTKRDAEAERLASTYFTLTDAMTAEGSQITIGRDTYTFTTDKSKIGKDGYVVYNEGDTTATKAQLLTKAAENNGTYTVGTSGAGKITITENLGQTNFDLTTVEGIEKSLGFKTATTNPVDNSKGLTLQIGPTSDSFNQLKVNIKDCHVKALGIGDIDISTQDGAQEAVDAIKSAINYVSDVRGTLGATQNRLDHTINNLSVMTENIQDAESTIRDTDIAEEMMAYTKNNILVQSAQAMLAQANQIPQGVLQLLG